MRRNHQKPLLFGATAVGAFLVLVSTAYACVTFWGQLNVTSGGGTSTAVGSTLHPNAANQEYCTPPTGGAATTPGARDRITVSVGPTQDCVANRAEQGVTTNALDDGRYSVRIQGGDAFEPHPSGTGFFRRSGPGISQCWNSGPTIVEIGFMQVNDQGQGRGSFKVPAELTKSGPSNAGAVCVRELPDASNRQINHTPEQGSLHVNSAPITII